MASEALDRASRAASDRKLRHGTTGGGGGGGREQNLHFRQNTERAILAKLEEQMSLPVAGCRFD